MRVLKLRQYARVATCTQPLSEHPLSAYFASRIAALPRWRLRAPAAAHVAVARRFKCVLRQTP
jgi:hypothetical protein